MVGEGGPCKFTQNATSPKEGSSPTAGNLPYRGSSPTAGSRPLQAATSLLQEHGVAEGEEAVALVDGVLVGGQNVLAGAES